MLQAQITPEIANPLEVRSTDRILSPINEQQRVTLNGQVHPLARAQFDRGEAQADFAMKRMILSVRGNPTQEAALDALVDAQRNSTSSLYHQWLTPEEFGERFGASQNDLTQIENWLQSHGFQVEAANASRQSIVFSGTAAQVQSAFHTAIHLYQVNGTLHHANATDPQIPAALSGVVVGIASLNDFFSTPQHTTGPTPDFTSGTGSHYLTPTDLATIYDVVPLYGQGMDGSGQSIAVVGRSDINLVDVRTFRSSFGLPAKDPTIIHPGASPGMTNTADAMESTLDVEWAGALAKKATIKFVPAASTNTTDGVYLSAQYIVNNNLAPVVTLSYGVCESTLGTAGNKFMSNLWQQAAAQGMSVFVSAGDSGAAGCDNSTSAKATGGAAVNGFCSTPYSVCVGGTQFNDSSNPTLYWSANNVSGTQSSALNYIPEITWNESSPGLYATGGGVSATYTKPAWQVGLGVPNDSMRDVPDVALTAAAHDGYEIYFNGRLASVGGTSVASPSMASIMALLVQHTEDPQGNPNPRFYALAASQRQGGAAIFHDITSGNNSVPGVTGFTAGQGYDQATGLGSVDAQLLVNHWSDSTAQADALGLTLQLSSQTQSSVAGSPTVPATILVTARVTGTDANGVALSATGLPAGVTAAFNPPSLGTPGSGTSTLTLTVAKTTVASNPGTPYTIVITGTPGTPTNTVATANLTLTVTGGQFVTIGTQPSAQTAAESATATFSVAATGNPTALTYQWHSQAPGGSDTTLTGATANKYTTPAVSLAQDQTAYWVVVSNTATSQTSTSAVLTVIPKAPLITTQPAGQTVILNGTSPNAANFMVGDSGEPGTTYQWQQCGPTTTTTLCAANGTGWANVTTGVGGTSAWYTTATLTPASNGTQYRVILSDSLCIPKAVVTSSAATVTVQYVANVVLTSKTPSVAEGSTQTFTVAATGNPSTFTYRWYQQAPGQPLELILGSTGNTYTTPLTTMGMNGTLYSVAVSNAAMSLTSSQAALTVTAGKPVIVTQPASQTVTANGTNTATFTVAGDGLHTITNYAWNKVAGKVLTPVGTNSPTYTTAVVTLADNATQYEVILTDAAGSVTSSVATLTVNYVSIGTQPANQSAVDGKSATFTVAATGNPTALSYQWYSGTPGSSTPIAGATSASLVLPPVVNSQNGAKFYVVVSNSAATVTSSAATLAVTPPGPTIANQPLNQAVVVGQQATFTVVPTAEPSAPIITYQWQKSTDGGLTWPNITGALSASYTTPATAVSDNLSQYHVILTDNTGHTTSTAAVLSVQYVTINSQPSSMAAQANNPATFVVGAVGNPGLQYQWYSQPPAPATQVFTAISGAIHSSYTIPSVMGAQDGTQLYVCVYNSAIPCSLATQSSTVTLNVTAGVPAAPVISAQPSSTTAISSTASATFAVVATGTPTPTFVWQKSVNNGPWQAAGGAVANTGTTSITSTLTMSGLTGSDDQTRFQVILTNIKGTVTSSAATLTVNHIIVPPANQTVNSGNTATLTVTASGSPTGYQWQKSTDGGTTWTNVTEGTVVQASSYTTGTLTSPYNGAQFRVQVTYAQGGTLNSPAATMSVNNITTQPTNQTANTGLKASFTVVATGSPTYQWMVMKSSSNNYQNVGEASGLTSNYTTGALDSTYDQAQYKVVVTYPQGSITSSAVTLNVNYIQTQPASQTADAGSTATFTVTATGSPTSYQWQKSTDGGTTWPNVTEGTVVQAASFTTGTLSSHYDGAQFRVVITYPQGTLTSSPATVGVSHISSQPTNQTANTGGEATFTVAVTGSPTAYQWSSSTDNGHTWNVIPTATARTYTTGKLSSTDDGSQYEVAVTYSQGTLTSNPATLTVNYIPTSGQPTYQTANQNGSATFTVAGQYAPTSIQWRMSTDHGNTWNDVSRGSGGATGSYTLTGLTNNDDDDLFQAVLTYPQGQITSATVMLTVNYLTLSAAPTVVTGNPATFMVVGTGSPTAYQWQKSTDRGNTYGNVASNGNTASYTTAALTSTDNNSYYRVKVTYPQGIVTSSGIPVTVDYITITGQPQATTVVNGGTTTFTVTAVGVPNTLTYQWHAQKSGGSDTLVSTNSASYTTGVNAVGDDQTSIWVVINNGAAPAQTSTPVLLTVSTSSPTSTAPQDQRADVGGTATFSVTGTLALSYQWESCLHGSDCSNAANWNPISGATSSTYTTPAVSVADDATEFHVIVTNGSGSITSSVATLHVSYVTLTAFLVDAEIETGAAATFYITTDSTIGDTVTYEWHQVTVGGTVGGAGDSIIAGAVNATYAINSPDSSMNGERIYVIVSNGYAGTGTITTKPVTFWVD
jgi:subtilase family serine protease